VAPEKCEANDREILVNLAIYDYHAAIDRGESPDPKAWAARHPEIAAELQVYFDDLAKLDRLGPPMRSVTLGATGPWRDPGPVEPIPPDAVFQPGDLLGDYVLLEKLGEGGQGVVWKARPQHSTEIVVALKTLGGPGPRDVAAVYRLREDARAIARMKHANIIQTSYFGEDRGRWFFAMELMAGPLTDRLASFKADPRSAAEHIEKIARAIHHAHTRNPGVLHLDLKPANILLTADGEPKVTDFGLSVRFEAIDHFDELPTPEPPGDSNASERVSATFAQAGIVGTVPYMSPEMAGGRWSDVSTGSDIYGIGAILYEMLTGRTPFQGRDGRETLALIVNGELASPRELNRQVTRELNAVCLKCLDRNPERRYGSADALANDLRRWLERRPTLAGGKPSVARELRFWMRRHTRGLALAAIASVLLWPAALAVSVANLREENGRKAERLAGQVDRELRLICRATQILANDPRLRADLASFKAADQTEQRQRAVETFLKTAVEGENLFGIAGGNPFVNVFVLDQSAVLLADTLPQSSAVGKNFRVRDYYRAFFENDWPRDRAYIARSFLSMKDARFKIAVSTRIWDGTGNLLGILVANFTIGPRLIDVDLRQEPSVAVLCPMDQADPFHGLTDQDRAWRYISVLDGRYTVDWKEQPFAVESPGLAVFQEDAKLDHATTGPWGGTLIDYHRVGETAMVIVVRRKCPWPLSWLPESR
jgi:eukaryotic-like serine/threonine-protein kinase